MFRCSPVILMCLMIAILGGNTDDAVPVFRFHVQVDKDDDTSCWSRRRRAKTEARRSYSLVAPPKNVNHGRWSHSGFDANPVTPPFSQNRRNRDGVKTFPPLGRRQRSNLGSSILK
jgi:hypothetical protein